ncbi:DUF3343 domain-containing protein [Clostridium pasteurianum]|uniref:Putative Se/S carrier protein-like domain-containing protein n=1 Tax=Clostridium pasteurianum BC1 TaxID=86416 RepID=R4JYV2_CLOPA|nr:DUF3343 domain-containing protein [Clostridium pasteurianum]AGK95473.1 Protein of unknown function (DUF3343) [Clostridium pasteurianum BC1]
MNIEIFNLITFNSTHSTIRAEKELLSMGIKVKVIPVPTEITSSCGLSIKISLDDLRKARKILLKEKIQVSGYYYIKKTGLIKEIRAIHE